MNRSEDPAEKKQTGTSLWNLQGLTIWQLFAQSHRRYRENHFGGSCAQFAYYSLLALAPLLIILIAFSAKLPLDDLIESFESAIAGGLPRSTVNVLTTQIEEIQERSSTNLVLVSFIILGIAGTRIFWTMSKALDLAFGVQHKRRVWIRGGMALVLTFGVVFLLLLTMVMLVIGPMIATFIVETARVPQTQTSFFFVVRWGLACLAMLFIASVVYGVIPNLKLRWQWVTPGSVFATLGWIVITQGFRIYVENFSRYNETYGALSGVVVLMTWLYFTGAVILFGGQMNAVIYHKQSEQET